jgi:hypothetical protein
MVLVGGALSRMPCGETVMTFDVIVPLQKSSKCTDCGDLGKLQGALVELKKFVGSLQKKSREQLSR